jgi:hypothetical protein
MLSPHFAPRKKAPFLAIFRQQQSAILAAFRSAKKKCHFSPFFANNKAPFFAAFRSAKKSAIFAKNFAKNRLDPTHSPKLDHFSPHFAPRKEQFFAIFRFAKKVPFSPHFAPRKISAIFRENFREKEARPNQHAYQANLAMSEGKHSLQRQGT